MSHKLKSSLTFVLFLLFCNSLVLAQDKVFMKSGRVLEGKVTEGEAKSGGDYIVLKTNSGSFYQLDKGDIVKTVLLRDQVDIDYQKRLALIRDIATDHVELAKWCEKQKRGKTRFAEQIRWHYENVVRLDPEHPARKKLGHMKLDDGTWVVGAELKSRFGYVTDRRRGWVAGRIKEVAAADDERDAAFGEKKKAFNQWQRQASRGNYQPAVLAEICDHSTLDMVYASAAEATNANNVELVRVHLDAIGTVGSEAAIRRLVKFAVEANNREIREYAIAVLSWPETNSSIAVLSLADALATKNRWIAHNAAFAIKEVASADNYSRGLVLVPLIDSLVTTLMEPIAGALPPGRMATSFGNGGTSFQTGGGPQEKAMTRRNEPSHEALTALFEADFGFDEDKWKEWYITNYTLYDQQVRTEE